MAQHIKTNIKFSTGIAHDSSRLCGFVTKVNGSWKGCRADDKCKKKIVFIDYKTVNNVIPNMLYQCVLIPMKKDGGFIAISAELVTFEATIYTKYNYGRFTVHVRFGNKCIVYDSESDDNRKRDINLIANRLRKRIDLKNSNEVVEDFINTACLVRNLNRAKR